MRTTVIKKKTFSKKMLQIGGSTLASRFLGLAREMLMTRYLAPGVLSDAFFTAFKIPNSLRKIFAEGALSASFIPTIVAISKRDKTAVNRLMTLSFLLFEGILLGLCLFVFWKAEWVIRFIAPGWYLCKDVKFASGIHWTIERIVTAVFPAWYVCTQPAAQAAYAIEYLRILISFIIFLSSSALLAGALQAAHHFFVPAFSQILINVTYIAGLLICMHFGLPVQYLCYFILAGGLMQFLLHVYMYFKLNFSFSKIETDTWKDMRLVLKRFFPCLFGMSVMEVSLFISTSLATYLPQGSVSLIYYANRFMGIPLGVFATAFSTILLPHFSRISLYAPKRLSFYLYEAAKLIFWVTIPTTLIMIFLSEKIFLTLFHSAKFSMDNVVESAHILIAFLIGLFFYSLNKILLNIFYALHDNVVPTVISCVFLVSNYLLSKLLFLPFFGAVGLAASFTSAAIIQTLLFIFFLHSKYQFTLYGYKYFSFVQKASLQMLVLLPISWLLYYGGQLSIAALASENVALFLLTKIGFWFWVGPLLIIIFILFLKTRKQFGIKIHFLD